MDQLTKASLACQMTPYLSPYLPSLHLCLAAASGELGRGLPWTLS